MQYDLPRKAEPNIAKESTRTDGLTLDVLLTCTVNYTPASNALRSPQSSRGRLVCLRVFEGGGRMFVCVRWCVRAGGAYVVRGCD